MNNRPGGNVRAFFVSDVIAECHPEQERPMKL